MAIDDFVVVPVNDALAGRLPPVCCMTGARADGCASVIVPKRLGIAWLLLLAGPIGVVVLVLLWPRVRVRYVAKLPMSAAAFDRMHSLRVRRLWCGWLGAIGLPVGLALRVLPGVGAATILLSLVGLVVALHAHLRLPWTMPTTVADVRGRTITLQGVHPRFVAAVQSFSAA